MSARLFRGLPPAVLREPEGWCCVEGQNRKGKAMVDYNIAAGGTVTVDAEGRRAELRRDTLPDDWERLLRDPDVAACVTELVRKSGAPASGQGAGGGLPSIGWDEVRACVLRTSGAGSSG